VAVRPSAGDPKSRAKSLASTAVRRQHRGRYRADRFADQLADAAFGLANDVDSGRRTVVEVSRFVSPAPPIDVFRIDQATKEQQIASVRALRASRDNSAVDAALAALRSAASQGPTSCLRR
jgi:methylmalonyl-CoA mutase N-terminal domain/subunit